MPDDASEHELSLLDSVDGCITLPSSVEALVTPVSCYVPVLDADVAFPMEQPSSSCHPTPSLSLEAEVSPPSIFLDSDFSPLTCPHPFVHYT